MKQSVQQELDAVQRYLQLHHGRSATLADLPEKSINGVLNQLSPEARAVVRNNMETVQNFRESGGRELPFQPKRSIDDLNLPAHTRAVMNRADTEDTTYKLNERLGTPTASAVSSQQSSAPPDLRETISASFDAEGA